jgi:hypothetical protein
MLGEYSTAVKSIQSRGFNHQTFEKLGVSNISENFHATDRIYKEFKALDNVHREIRDTLLSKDSLQVRILTEPHIVLEIGEYEITMILVHDGTNKIEIVKHSDFILWCFGQRNSAKLDSLLRAECREAFEDIGNDIELEH